MTFLSNASILLVALLHVYFLILEMFLWDKPLGLKTFKHSPNQAQVTKVLAANQGLYNGFLAAGLIWGLALGEAGLSIKTFFLICIIIAGIYGALSANRNIFWVQALPAIIALGFIFF